MKFELNQEVKIYGSDHRGQVMARAEYVEHPPEYWVRYVDNQGELVRRWHTETDIAEADCFAH